MKPYLSLLILCSVLIANTGHACKEGNQTKWIYMKGVVTEIEQNAKTKRLLNPRRAIKMAVDKKVVDLVTDFRGLNKKLINAKTGNNKLAKKYLTRYSKLERRADSFAARSGGSEGIGACMSECGDYFPGTGGGNGVNRVACKIGCLVHGN